MTGSLLLVDDEPGVRDSLGEYFLGEGYQVAVAASEDEAYEVYRHLRPAVVVSDMYLKPGSGISLIQRLKREDADELAPYCILMTGHGTVDRAGDALRSGADQYLTKPLKLKQLQSVVDIGLARHRDRTGAQGPDMDVYLEPLDPEALLAEVQKGFLPAFERKGIDVAQTLGTGLPRVWTDKRQAHGLLAAVFTQGLALARPGSTVNLDWDRSGPGVDLRLLVGDAETPLDERRAWPSDLEAALLDKGRLRIEIRDQGCLMVVHFNAID